MFKLNPFHKRPLAAPSSNTAEVNQQKAKRSPHHPFTEDGIRKRAQKIYEKRMEEGLVGTPEGDWKQAIRDLRWERSPLGKFYQWTGLGQKNGWDLLTGISLPLVLFLGGSLFTHWNNQQQQQIADLNNQQQQQIADDKAKQEIFNKYLDQMADSLKDGLLKAPLGSEKFTIAQARTITALLSLDKRRQSLLIQFLSASGLNQVESLLNKVAVDENGNVKLGKGDRVLLYKAQMAKVNLANSDLSGAWLVSANLKFANLGCNPPNSRDSHKCSDLSDANLIGVNLYGANLSGANLYNADLYGANLVDARFGNDTVISDKQLSQAKLCHTNLPDRSKLDPNRDCKKLSIIP